MSDLQAASGDVCWVSQIIKTRTPADLAAIGGALATILEIR